ncbi:uncharacterized protein [Clytia hemisphaerica]|uniref:uncharacterized protein n=1 Tax=Clytia hemisphaerica TaxID=252671 RepID=UPI0034D55189
MSVKKYVLRKTRELLYTDTFQLKKRLVVMSFVLRYFLMGVEYSIILPTALLYMKTFNAGPFMTGLTIAAYPAAACISLPIFGYLYDRTKRLKELLLILNLFEAIGNLIYALPFSIAMPLLGRFIAGIGDGFLALTVGELTYLYEEKQRLGILSILEFGRVLGLIIGPSFNFLIEGRYVVIDSWVLNNNTLPGVIMAILWLMMEFLTVFVVFNLAKDLIALNKPKDVDDTTALLKSMDTEPIEGVGEDLRESELSDNEDSKLDIQTNPPSRPPSLHSSNESLFHPTLEKQHFDKKLPLEDDEQSISSNESSFSDIRDKDEINDVGHGIFHEKHFKKFTEYWNSIKEILCFEFLVITATDFTLWFCQTNFEILAPYITEFDYGWTPQMTGMIYVVGGFLIIIVFLLMYFLSAKCAVKDSYLLLTALIATQISLVLLVYEANLTNIPTRETLFAIISVFVFFTIPLNLVCSKTLLSKLFHPDRMGAVQGLSSGISRITMIIGPIISGYIFKHRIIYASVTSVFLFITVIGFFSCINKIHKRIRSLRRELRVSSSKRR